MKMYDNPRKRKLIILILVESNGLKLFEYNDEICNNRH